MANGWFRAYVSESERYDCLQKGTYVVRFKAKYIAVRSISIPKVSWHILCCYLIVLLQVLVSPHVYIRKELVNRIHIKISHLANQTFSQFSGKSIED
jgi:hypothetical protein